MTIRKTADDLRFEEMSKYLKFKRLEWTKEETRGYGDGIEETLHASQYFPKMGKVYNIVESGGRFYPIFALEPADGFATIEQAKSFAQATFEEDVMVYITEGIEEWGGL